MQVPSTVAAAATGVVNAGSFAAGAVTQAASNLAGSTSEVLLDTVNCAGGVCTSITHACLSSQAASDPEAAADQIATKQAPEEEQAAGPAGEEGEHL